MIMKPKSKSRLMKERRRRQAKRRFLPEKTGDNKIHMTASCRRVLNKWVKGKNKVNRAELLNKLLTKRVE